MIKAIPILIYQDNIINHKDLIINKMKDQLDQKIKLIFQFKIGQHLKEIHMMVIDQYVERVNILMKKMIDQ